MKVFIAFVLIMSIINYIHSEPPEIERCNIVKAALDDDLLKLINRLPVMDDTVNIILELVEKIDRQTRINHRRINKILK